MARIAVVGAGHVGLVTAACFAHLGHSVTCLDVDHDRIALLQQGVSPIHEPGLDDLLRQGVERGLIAFRADYPQALDVEFAFVAVGTPPSAGGSADLRAVREAVASLLRCLPPRAVIVNKATVPIGTADLVEQLAARMNATSIAVVSNPEFLQEGTAIDNFLRPDRVILGSRDEDAVERTARLFESLGAPIMRVDTRSAEMVKYAANAFLATKISFMNEIATICEQMGADAQLVAKGIGADDRIGPRFLGAGLGWGGSCLPKDTQSLAHLAAAHGAHPQLLRAVMQVNQDQRRLVVSKVRSALGDLERRRVLVLGAAFKPGTDDTRFSPAIELAQLLQSEGAEVLVFDPVVTADRIQALAPGVRAVASVEEGAQGAEAIILATEWPEFRELPFAALAAGMRRALLVDGRNYLDPARLAEAGFEYRCVGRPSQEVFASFDFEPSVVAGSIG
ncbi:MAG: UDP-glucose/GDP-mannose dehydrogenase family protein [Dehalococcoidia bacterium]|nr:UDP-glucose/GDP-mannose dehydrogenase family protein [Dehalococcoidia bacterium]